MTAVNCYDGDQHNPSSRHIVSLTVELTQSKLTMRLNSETAPSLASKQALRSDTKLGSTHPALLPAQLRTSVTCKS